MAKEVDVHRQAGGPSTLPDMSPEFERMVESFFGDRFGSLVADWPINTPRVSTDVRETENAYIMSVDLPGFAESEIDVSVSGNLLNIVAEHQEGEAKAPRKERRSYRQSFTLPTSVATDQIEAHSENGVLEVYIPKAETAQNKKVRVQTGRGSFFDRIMGKDKAAEDKH